MAHRRLYPEDGYAIKEVKMWFIKKFITLFHASGPMRVFWKWHLVSTVLFLVMVAYRLLEVWTDIVKITAIMGEFIVLTQAIWKATAFVYYAPLMHKMHADIDFRFWDFGISTKKLEGILNKHMRWLDWLLKGYFAIGTGAMVVYQVFPVDIFPPGRRQLTVPIRVPFDINPSPIHEVVWVYGLVCQQVWVLAIAMFDLSFLYFAQHLSAQLDILKEKLENLTEDVLDADDYTKVHSGKFQKEVFRRLVVCTRHHNLLLEFGRNLGDFSSISFGLQLLGSLLSMVMGGFQLSQEDADYTDPDTLKQIHYTVVLSTQLVLFAVFGSILEFKSGDVATAAYNCKWYLCEPKVRKGLVLLQMNARKEVKMKAAGLAELNNNTWLQTCRTAFSCITLLHSIDTINENNLLEG